MLQETGITVKNKLIREKRDINVYHQATRSAHIISRNSSITLPLGTSEKEDYLHISVISGPGNLWKNCLIDLPSWADFGRKHGRHPFPGSYDIKHSPGPTHLATKNNQAKRPANAASTGPGDYRR